MIWLGDIKFDTHQIYYNFILQVDLLGMFMMLHKSLQQKLQRNLLMELIELNPRATMSLKPGRRDVQNIDLRWILATIVESGNR